MKTFRPWVVIIWDKSNDVRPMVLGYKTEHEAIGAIMEALDIDDSDDMEAHHDGMGWWSIDDEMMFTFQQISYPVE